jgi:YVTN family beta-propeller protein
MNTKTRTASVWIGIFAAVLSLLLGACSQPDPDAEQPPEDVVDPDVIPTPEAPDDPEDVAPTPIPDTTPEPDPSREVWVAVEAAGRLVRIDLDANEIVEVHETPGGPHNLVVAADGTVAAALYASTQLAIVRDGQLTFVELGGEPHDPKAIEDRFVVANEAGRRVDLVRRDGTHLASIDLRHQPHDLAITPDGRRAWVTLNRTDELALIDLDTPAVVDYVPTGQRPHDILVGPDGRIWVTDWGGGLHVFMPDGQLETSLELGAESHHLAFTPDGQGLWVTDHGTNDVFVVDAATAEIVDVLDVPGSPHHITITADGRLAAVADHTNGTVVIYDVASRQQVGVSPVGAGPHGVWAVP